MLTDGEEMLGKFKTCLKKVNGEIERMHGKWEFLFICVLALVLVAGVVFGMGTFASGFHLVDDHEFLEWIYEMRYQNKNVLDIIWERFWRDLSWRYEPLYYFNRILSCYLFGENLVAYSMLKALEFMLSIIFLYYCGREMGAGKIYSVLFALTAVVGYQSAVWWKLGPQEAQGTLLFSLGFLCMMRYLKSNQKKWMGGSIFLFILMVNYKESFIILMPFLMSYVVYYEINFSEDGNVTLQGVWRCIRKRLGYLITLGVIFLVPVLIIVFYVGTNKYSNVGLDISAPISEYVAGIRESLNKDLKWYKRFGTLFCMILLTYWEELKKLWKEMLLTVIFLLPQFILFGRSGIGERYVLPTAIGIAYFFVIVILKWKPLSGKRRVVYVLGLLLCLAAHGRVMLREADYYTYRGKSVTSMLEAVEKMKKEDSNVLACFRPNEEGNLTINFWMKLRDFDNVYYWTEENQTITRVCDASLYYPEEYHQEENFDDMDIIVMYNREDRHWVYDLSMDLTDFQEIPCGTLTIYVRNGSVDEMVRPQMEGLKIHF